MTPFLIPPVFVGGREFSVAELSAARLDGDVVGVGDAFAPTGEVVDHRHRALAMASDVPAGGTVVGRSAAWLHGGSGGMPLPVEIGVSGPSTRWAEPFRTVRSMRIRAEHRHLIGFGDVAVAVLSPVATVIDLSRVDERPGDSVLIHSVIRRRGLELSEALETLDRWSHLPGKRDVVKRLEAAFAISLR